MPRAAILLLVIAFGAACGDGAIGDSRSGPFAGELPDDGFDAPPESFGEPDAGVSQPPPPAPAEDEQDPIVPPKAGSWPATNEPLGHRHPECQALYGKTPAQIEATLCGISGGKVPGDQTYTACAYTGGLDFQGSNVTFDCVKWATGNTTFGTRCEGAPG